MDAGVVAISGVAGLFVGSVLNVVIDRVPSKEALRGPRDGEPCAPASWLGLPAQPWLLRRGRSAGEALPVRWVAVEVATAAAFGLLAVRYGEGLELLPLLVLAASLVAVSVIDLQLLRIPDRITFPTLAVSMPLVLAVSLHRDVADAFNAAVIGAIAYFLLLLVPHLVYPKGMGFGDVKLALVMGLYLGWVGYSPVYPVAGPLRLVLYALMLGCLIGVVFGLAVQVVTGKKGAFPFGPALALGCLVVIFYANDLRY